MTIEEYLSRLLAHTGVEKYEVVVTENEDRVEAQINVDESDVGILIGYHGETLAALQRMVRLVFKDEISTRFMLNINDYKERREEKLREMTLNIAQKVLEVGEDYVFPYLPANERFFIHSELSTHPEFEALESVSEGEGLNRRLVIRLKQKA